MEEITVEQLENNFDEYFNRVENGEKFLIKTSEKDLILLPFDEYSDYYDQYFSHNDAP
jgi:PHD/YefM family antitoxin component YafN of YafNO toxin-antitoxin module